MRRQQILLSLVILIAGFGSPGIAAAQVNDGYNLFAPIQSTDTYLMDNDGTVVHTWAGTYSPALSVYLLEDTTLLRTAKPSGGSFDSGGAGGRVELYDWDGNLAWSYDYSSASYCLHHDVEHLPNGNILLIAWELKTQAEAVAAGRDPSLLSDGELWPDHIIEVAPSPASGGTIVWEWHVWDHLVQDHDVTKANYGTVADHPELIDLNYAQNAKADWNHSNSVAYTSQLDQIMLSVRNFSEIWVIDHSTTSAEAAGHSGGNSGRGGDLLYRWGNPQAYDAGTAADQQLFVQHDAEWIASGLPGAGNILIFNNGKGRSDGSYSTVDEIEPPLEADGSYGTAVPYGPVSPTWTYQASPTSELYAERISGSQRLLSGNTLICDGPGGRFLEVTSGGSTVWEHDATSEVFRVERYDPGYTGLSLGGTATLSYPIVDTAQDTCYNGVGNEITAPAAGAAFSGQDAQYHGTQPSYTLSADGLSVADNNTGLTWTQTPDTNGDGTIDSSDKLSWAELPTQVADLNATSYGGYDDWRVPTIKELYSLMDFRGLDPTSDEPTVPFIDTAYFAFGWGDLAADERIIDAQYWSSTEYLSTTMNGNATVFGVNFADGRIKGYPRDTGAGGGARTQYIRLVRGNPDYGVNDLVDNADGTITDHATGLMWQQADSGTGMSWQEALASCEGLELAGHSDWRLPNAKELQSLIDYSRSPDTTTSAAIDPLFSTTQISNENLVTDYPYYWTGTTHANNLQVPGRAAAYLSFGRGMGYMFGSWLDVHGAGCQRSDPKEGNLADYTYVPYGYYFGNAPQGDAIRLSNFARCVRDAPQTATTDIFADDFGSGDTSVWSTTVN